MFCFVYRQADGGDCTNGGCSSKSTYAVLLDPKDTNYTEEATKHSSDTCRLQIVRRKIYGKDYLHAVPCDIAKSGKHSMFGGNFIWSSDSRFRAISEYPIPVHDRVE